MRGRREMLALCLFGALVAAVVAAGIGVRATYGAQTTGDEPQYLLSAMSFWEDRDLDISDELADERYRSFHEVDLPQQTMPLDDGRRISPHDPLLPALLAAPMGIGGWIGAKVALAVLGGALAALTVWTARVRFGVTSRTAYLVAAVFALAPPLAVYSTQVYPEIPAALVLLAGLAAGLGPFGRPGRIVFLMAVVALPWLAVKYVPLAVVLAIAGLLKATRGQRVWLITAFSLAGVLYVVGHLAIYDGLTAYASGDHFVGGELTAMGTEVDLWGRSTRLIGLLVDRAFGIGVWQPAFLMLPLIAGWALVALPQHMSTAAGLLGSGWLVATFAALTMHGWWFPGRQLVVVLPVAIVMVSVWVDEAPQPRRAIVASLGLAGMVAFGFLVAEGLAGRLTWVVDFAATSDPLYRAVASVMPDYMSPTPGSWVLHGTWVVVALALAWVGWRDGSTDRGGSGPPDPESLGSGEKVVGLSSQ